MTDLGKAYVQIMPSAKGIAGSIAKTIEPEAVSAGKGAGKSIASNISKTLGSMGKTLTKSITLPIVGAATAASGFLLKGGWDRIVGLDSARAQLEGLGYDLEAVERISNLVNESIQGTVMTMADGVSIAAGALAAGVKEGEELERFIGLVGDAAVGSGRDVSDMAMIFNRVQGMGKLMTQELNMIEDGMPGFSQAMAKHFGVGQAEFREMVTAGEVSSEDFLNVMDDFAGGMSDAYSKSWRGIFSRVKSNLAILGEYMLEGMFPDAKEALADFLETIREDDIRNWARGIGDTIGETFRNIVQGIKDVVNWWGSLSDGTKDAIKTVGVISVAMGPVLSILSKLIPIITTVIGVVQAVSGALAGGATAFGALKAGMLAIMGPAGWIVALIAGIVAAGIALYMNWDTIKEKASQLGEWLSSVWTSIKTTVTEAVMNVWNSTTTWFGGLPTWFSETWNSIVETVTTWVTNMITKAIEVGTQFLGNITTFFSKLPYNIGFFLGSALGAIIQWVIDTAANAREAGSNFITNISEWFRQLPGRVQTWLTDTINRATTWGSNMGTKARETGSRFVTNVINFVQQLPGRLQTWLSNALSRATTWATDLGRKGGEAGRDLLNKLIDEAKKIPGRLYNVGKDVVTGFWDGIKSMGSWLKSTVGDFFGGIVDGVKDKLSIFSPSRVFRDEIGVMVARGFGDGIEKGEKYALNPLESMIDDALGMSNYAMGTFNGGLVSGLSVNTAGGASHLRSATPQRNITVYNKNISPEPLTEREIARQTRLSLQRIAYDL